MIIDVPFLARSGVSLRTPATAMNVVPIAIDLAGKDASAIIDYCEHALANARPHSHARSEQARRAHTALGAPTPVADLAMNLIPFSPELWMDGTRAAGTTLSSGPGDVPAVGIRGQSDGTFHVEVDAPPRDDRTADATSEDLAEQFLCAFTELVEGRYLNDTDEAVPRTHKDVLELIKSHVDESPGCAAFIDSTTGETTSYQDIWEAAGALAQRLVERGIGPEQVVGVCAPRGPQHAIAVIGVLRAGGAFVPLPPDATESAARRRIVATIPFDMMVSTDLSIFDKDVLGGTTVLPVMDEQGQRQELRLVMPAHEDQLAYVIATSGSSGVPKPVAVSRGALATWIAAILDDYLPIGPADRVAQFAAVQFDASVEELFGALCSGASLVPRSARALENVGTWLDECAAREVTVLDLPTGYWHELVRALDAGSAQLPSSVHTVIIGGEAASVERLRQWRVVAPGGVRLVNTYGPTETTVVATRHVLSGPPLL